MRNRQRISKTAALALLVGIVALWAAPAAAIDGNGGTSDPSTTTTELNNGEVRVEVEIAEELSAAEAQRLAIQAYLANGGDGDVECVHISSGGAQSSYCGDTGGGGYTPPLPTTKPSQPSPPSRIMKAVSLECTSGGWTATWGDMTSSNVQLPTGSNTVVEYEAIAYEVQWRPVGPTLRYLVLDQFSRRQVAAWRDAATPTSDGDTVTVSGAHPQEAGVQVQVRVEARMRRGNVVGWSDWSEPGWGAWPESSGYRSRGRATATCPDVGPPREPDTPSLTTPPSVRLSCPTTGWTARWSDWADHGRTEYDTTWEAQWRNDSGVWLTATPTVSGRTVRISGGPEPSQDVEVRVRGRARQRVSNSIGDSYWSAMSPWTTWSTATTTCATPPPPPPPQPARPAAPAPPAVALECRTVPPLNQSLTAEALFTASSDTSTERYEYRVLWANNRGGGSLPPDVQAQLDAAVAALAHAQLASTQQAAADAAAAAETARIAAETAAATLYNARLHYDAVDAAATTALQHRNDAHLAKLAAEQAAADAEAAAGVWRTSPAPTLTAAVYTADTTLTAEQHAQHTDTARRFAESSQQIAEDERDTAITRAPLADSSTNHFAVTVVAAADASADAAQQASDAYDVAEAHFVLVQAMLTDADTALRTAEIDDRTADAANRAAQAAAEAAVEAADIDAAQQVVDTLTVAANPNVILLDETPTIASGTGNSTVVDPTLIASLDTLQVAVSVRTSIRAVATNPGGTSYSPWSDWSYWSDWSGWVNDRGDQWTDANANGQYGAGEPYVDTNSNGIYDPPAGCPIVSVPITPINTNPCPHDSTLQAAVYPPGHAEPYTDTNGNGSYDVGERFNDINEDGSWTADLGGHPTGFCFPVTTPPHVCLVPPAVCTGTGS